MKNIKTKKVKKVNQKMMIATIDIGKKVQYGYFRAPNGEEITPFRFYNDRANYNEFWRRLCEFKEERGLEEAVIGYESTSSYAEPLTHFLKEKEVKLIQVNPMHTRRMKDIIDNSPNKTDKKDPRVIADIISHGHGLTTIIPRGPWAELRRLTNARERVQKERIALMNRLQEIFFPIFPEFSKIIKLSTKTGREIIKRYGTPLAIKEKGLEKLIEIIRERSRGKIRKEKAEKLYEAATNSIGIREGSKSMFIEIKRLIRDIEREEEYIKEIEGYMKKYLGEIPYSKNILSIKGIGVVTASGLIGEIGDMREFNTLRELMKLGGLDLYEISSGSHRGKRRISKRGRPLMRKLLYFAAVNTVRTNGIMYEKYMEMLERGKNKTKALIAISRKLLGIIFALVRNNTYYIENYQSA